MDNFYIQRRDKMPSRIIIGVDNHLKELKLAISQPELPVIDLDALLDFVVDALHHEPTAQQELNALPYTFMRYDVLGSRTSPKDGVWDLDNPWENLIGLEYVISQAIKMGHALHGAIKGHRLLENQYFKFTYEGVLDDRSILFRRRR